MVYFDHAATTLMRDVARQAWLDASYNLNPAGQYQLGRDARRVLEDAREQVALLIGCEPIEVVFTASGTEANNIALKGFWAARNQVSNRVVISAVEHSAVYETAHALAQFGAQVEQLGVNEAGVVDNYATALSQPAAVVSCMWANNETGAIQPIEHIIAAANETATPVHVDAVQVIGKLPVDFHRLKATSLAISGHKFGGPRGVGALVVKRSPVPLPLFHGGGQERGLRSGTVDVAGAVGFAAALQQATETMSEQQKRIEAFKQQLVAQIATIPGAKINTPENSLATHINVSFSGCEGDSLIMLLDAHGIAASTGSACANGVNRASRVLLAQGVPEELARGTLRLTLGYTTTQDDVDQLIQVLPQVVAQAQKAGMAGGFA